MTGEILTEDEALTLYRGWGKLRPEQLPRAKERLRTYMEERKTRGEPLWPARTAARRRTEAERMESLWLGDDPGTPEARDARQVDFLSTVTRRPPFEVGAGVDRYRRAVADWLGNPDAGATPEAFDTLAREQVRRQRDRRLLIFGNGQDDEASKEANAVTLTAAAGEAARKGEDAVSAFMAWQATAAGKPGYDDARAEGEGLYSQFQALHREAWDHWRELEVRADKVIATLTAQMNDDSPFVLGDAALPHLDGLTRPERYAVLGLVAERAKPGEKGFAQQSGETVGRVLARLNESVADAFSRQALDSLTFSEGQEVLAKVADNPAALVTRMASRSVAAAGAGMLGDTSGMAGVDPEELFGDTVALTKEQADAANAEVGRRRESLSIAAQLRDVARGAVDPVRGDNVMTRWVWYPFLNVGSSLATFAAPGGWAANAAAYVNDEQNRLEALGVDRSTAAAQAAAVGSLQAFADKLQLKFLAALPAVRSLHAALKAPAASLAGAVGRRVPAALGITAIQSGIEAGQEALPLLVQKTLAALGVDEPDIPWKDIGREAWAAVEQSFFGILPLVLIGSGIGGARDFKKVREILRDGSALQELGFSETAAARIMNAGTEENMVRALREEWPARQPKYTAAASPAEAAADAALQSPLTDVSMKASAAQLKADMTEARAFHARMEALLAEDAGVVSVQRTDAGWQVRREDGQTVTLESPAEVRAALLHMAHARDRESAQELIAEVEALTVVNEKRGEGTEVSFTGETRKAAMEGDRVTVTKMRDGKHSALEVTPESLARLHGEMTALGLPDAVIRGSNWLSEDAGKIVRHYELNLGSDVSTVVHERVESLFKSGVAAPAEVWAAANQLAALPQFDPAKIKDPGQRRMAESLRRIALEDDSVTEDERRETLVELVVADYLGRWKDGTKFAPGSLRDAVRRAEAGAKGSARRALAAFSRWLAMLGRYFGALFGTVKAIREARASGELKPGEAWDSFVDKLLGADGQKAHEAAVMEAAGVSPSPPAKTYNVSPAAESRDRYELAILRTEAEIAALESRREQNDGLEEDEQFELDAAKRRLRTLRQDWAQSEAAQAAYLAQAQREKMQEEAKRDLVMFAANLEYTAWDYGRSRFADLPFVDQQAVVERLQQVVKLPVTLERNPAGTVVVARTKDEAGEPPRHPTRPASPASGVSDGPADKASPSFLTEGGEWVKIPTWLAETLQDDGIPAGDVLYAVSDHAGYVVHDFHAAEEAHHFMQDMAVRGEWLWRLDIAKGTAELLGGIPARQPEVRPADDPYRNETPRMAGNVPARDPYGKVAKIPQEAIRYEARRAGFIVKRMPEPDTDYQGGETFSIGRAVELARKSRAAATTAENEFFEKFWPRLLKMAGQKLKPSLRNINEAARRAVEDIAVWVKENPRFLSYYDTDWANTKAILQEVFPDFTGDQFTGFRIFTGLTSPSTPLDGNLADALQVINLWRETGSLKSLTLQTSPRGNRMAGPAPFTLRGNTGATKIFSLHVVENLFRKLGSWDKVLGFLTEGVATRELHAFNKEMGYAGSVGQIGDIRRVVKEATGQEARIPRMFIFGPKVGAYTLNTTGDHRYTTTDIWESRFIRSYFPEMFKTATGLPVNVDEHTIFQRFSGAFLHQFKAQFGIDIEPSALQAARWFYMIAKAKEAGYRYGNTSGTISDYTLAAARRIFGRNDLRGNDHGGRRRGDGRSKSRTGAGRVAETRAPKGKGDTFSLGSVSVLEKVARRIEDSLSRRGAAARLEILSDMARTLAGMARAARSNEDVERALKVGEIEQERKKLQQRLADDYILEVYRGPVGAALGEEENTEITSHPFLSKIIEPGGGKLIQGRLLSPAKARKQGKQLEGEYDGAREWGLPGWLFKGEMTPDLLSDELGFERVDDMWEEIASALQSLDKARERLRKAQEQITEAKTRARTEARAWAAAERVKMALSDQRDARRALVALDAMLMHLPAEVRAKVGGFAVLSDLKTNQAREAHFLRLLDRIDTELESYLRKQYVLGIREVIDRGKARRRPGEKDRGKLGVNTHTWLEAADAITIMGPARLAEREAYVAAKLGGAELTVEEITELNRQWDFGEGEDAARLALEQESALLDLFGGITHSTNGRHHRSSGELEAAWIAARETVKRGRDAWNDALNERRARRAGRRAGLMLDAGNDGSIRAVEERKESMKGWGGAVVRYFRKGFSFEQFIGDIFGRGSDTHRWAEDTAREAELTEAALFQQSQRDTSDMLRSLWPRSNTAGRLRHLEALATPRDVPGAPKGMAKISELQAVHFTMLWADHDSRPWLRKYHLGDGAPLEPDGEQGVDTQAALESFLSPQAKAIRAWLQERYDAQYDVLNAVYRRLHGVNMPRVKNYSPRMVEHGKDAAVIDPLGPGGLSARGVFAGFTKRRQPDLTAAPVAADALQAFMQNQRVVTHFVAWAEASLDLRAVFSSSESAPFIKAAAGEQGQADLLQWLTDLEAGGVREAQASAIWRRWLRANTDNALVGKLGVLAKQIPALYGAAADIGWGDYLASARRVAAGTAARPVKEAIESRIMRARGFERPPEIAQAASRTGASPLTAKLRRLGVDLNRVDLAMDFLRGRIGATDAWFTARGAAIAYDAHFRDGKAQKMSDADAHAYAERETERTVSRTAQPDTLANKSLAENHAGTFGRLLHQFQSANRQALFMTIAAFRDGGIKSGTAWRMAVTHWALTGIVTQTVGSLIRDALSDADDDEIWNLGDYTRAILLGPLTGAVHIGPIIDAVASLFGGFERRQAAGIAAAATDIGKEFVEMLKEGDEIEWRDQEKAVRGLGLLLGGRWSALNVAENVGKQLSALSPTDKDNPGVTHFRSKRR